MHRRTYDVQCSIRWLVCLCVFHCLAMPSWAQDTFHSTRSPFKATLTESHDPELCKAFKDDVQAQSSNPGAQKSFTHFGQVKWPLNGAAGPYDLDGNGAISYLTIDEACCTGGASTYTGHLYGKRPAKAKGLTPSNDPPGDDTSVAYYPFHDAKSPDANGMYGSYQAPDVYIFGKHLYDIELTGSDQPSSVARLHADGTTTAICAATVEPNRDTSLLFRSGPLHDFMMAALAIAGQDDFCGADHYLEGHRKDAATAYRAAIFQPEALDLSPTKRELTSWDNLQKYLSRWSYLDPVSYTTYRRYLALREPALKELSDYYVRAFGVSPQEARIRASWEIDVIQTQLFYFLQSPEEYWPHVDDAVIAVTDGVPLGKVKAAFEQVLSQKAEGRKALATRLLRNAVLHPSILRWLLAQGADVEVTAVDGETLLMSAARLNLLTSVKLLLHAGANPDAKTHQNPEVCRDTTASLGLSALHYALRYASRPVIETLLKVTRPIPDKQEADKSLAYKNWLNPKSWSQSYFDDLLMKNLSPEPNPYLSARDIKILSKDIERDTTNKG